MAKVVFSFFVVLSVFVVESWCLKLKPGGKNVLTKYETYYVTIQTSTKIMSYRKTCTWKCWVWPICSTKCRNVPIYRWTTVNKQVKKTRPVYECKQGWKANGTDECTTPICVGGCKNYGVCKAPNTCHCRAGWLGHKCHIGEPCVKMHAPINGEMNCTGNTTAHVCYFKCLPGYKLLGSTSRNCSGNNTWTSEETTCKIIHCPDPVAPGNSFVYSPCRTEFNSTCVMGCAYGYFIEGTSGITCDASGVWEPNVSCKEIKACQPNPCKNGGKCSSISSSRYSCHCSHTGYRGSNCEVGYIVTPTYPTLTSDIPPIPLQFQSSPPSGHVTLMPKCSGIEFNPPSLIFTATSTQQFINITAKHPGLYFVEYLLFGPGAVHFEPPEKDIIFVEEAQNSTNKTTGDSSSLRHFTLPVGCHKLEIGKCPRGDDVIVSSSTSSWKARGPVTSTDGVVTLEAGKTVLPLSLLGASIKSKNSPSDDEGCEAFQSNYSSEELIKSNVLTRSFLETFQSSLPSWMVVALPRSRKSKSFFKSDVRTLLFSDSELRQMKVGSGQPLIDNTSFSLLLSRNINLTVEGDTDILGSYHKSPFAMAVDLCSPSPKTVIVRPASRNVDEVKNISIFKRLMMNGWDLTIHSLQISRTRSIEKLEKGLYWNGEDFIRIDSSTKRNLALVSSLKKSFRNQGIVNCHVIFDGTMVIGVDNLDNVLHSPLNQEWSVDLYGNTKLTLEVKVEGKKTNVTLNAPQSINYATFGGLRQNSSGPRRPAEGLYISQVLEECPFLQSDLGNFVKLGTNKTLSVVLRTKLQPTEQEGNQSENGGVVSGVSMAFRGHLKFGPLRFEDVDIRLLLAQQSNASSMLVEKSDSGIMLTGNYRDNVPRKLGIFKTTPLYPRLYIAREKNRSSWGSFQSVVKLLGFEKQVNVSFSGNGLNFNASSKIHGLYDAQMRCHSRLASWEDQGFAASGEFGDKSGGLIEALDKALHGYGIRVLDRATRRVTAFKQREERAKKRLQNILIFTETKRDEMNKAEDEYMAAEKSLKTAELSLKNLESNISGRLTRLRLQLDELCHVKQCRDVCREGVVCRKCDYEVIGKSKETCLDSCYKTEQRRIALSGGFCKKHDCKRIYLKSALFGSDFENTIAKITQKVFSYSIKSSDSLSNGYSAMTGVRSYAPGNSNEDVCTNTNIPRNLDGSVLSNPFEDFVTSGFHGKKTCRKDRRNGYWDCRVRSEKCGETRFEYENYQKRYTCERSCEVHVTTEIVPKSCCSTVSCAFSIVNVTCAAENILCSRARSDALKKVVHSPNSSAEVLEELESARSNVSYWKITKRRAGARLLSASNSLNISQKAVGNLMKAYNITVKSRENISRILAQPLRLKELLNDPLKSAVKIQGVRFNVQIDEEDGPTLLPVQVRFNLNGSQQELSAVLDFKNLNTSFKSIAKDILDVYMGRALTDKKRRKRSTEETRNSFAAHFSNETVHHTISSLQKYHKLCSEFTNFEQSLYDIIMYLYNLTSETKQLINQAVRTNTSQQFNASSVLESWRMNETIAAGFGLNISKNVSSLENDPVLVGALRLENEAVKDGFEPLYLTSELLFKNWYSAMENIFGVVIKNCSGFDDCVAFILDSLFEMHEDVDVPGADVVQQKITEVRTMLFNLIQSLDLSIEDAAEISSNILRILNDIKEVKSFCAHSPNITKHPEPFTEMGVARTLVLICNATGDDLVYKWRFNHDLLEDQTTNVLLIRNTTVSHGGNYTCEVSNHISKEVSTPALVLVHPSPSITVQPVDSLSVILFSNDSLHCKAQSSDNHVVYQWRFKCLNSTTFLRLPNETFPYLKFSPMKAQHEGWYFCNVSNSYGFSISKISLVTALRFTLSLPTIVMSLSVTSEPIGNATVFRRSTQDYASIYSQMLHILSVASGHVSNVSNITNPQIKDLRLVSCAPIKSAQTGAHTTAETCRWKFYYVGGNTTTGDSSANKTFEMSAQKVIDSARDVQRFAGRILNATNNGALSFTTGNKRYILEPYTFTVEKFSMACGLGLQLIQEDLRCVECPPGYYGQRNAVNVATCQPCPFGFYQTNTGQTSCTECPKGFTTVNQASYDESQCKVICPAGHYGRVNQNIGQCLECPLGKYQPKKGQFKCQTCPAGRVTAGKGAEDVSKCIPEPTERHTTEKQTSTERHTTVKQTSTERRTTVKQTNTERHTTAKQTSEATEPQTITGGEPTAEKLVGTNYAPAIGGGAGGFVLILGLLILLFLLLRRKRRNTADNASSDKKEIVRSQSSFELTDWRENPAYSEEGDFVNADTANPTYESSGVPISPSNEQATVENPIYAVGPPHYSEPLDEKTPPEASTLDNVSNSDLKLYKSYDNAFTTDFGNPLYDALSTVNSRKEIKLLDGPITDEDV